MAVLPIIAVAAAAVQAIGSIKQGNAAKAAGDYNAKVAEQNANQSMLTGTEEARRYRIQARKQIGDQRANFGASGVTLEGSPLDVLEESAATAELDALTIQHGGGMRAAGFGNEAATARYEGREARKSSGFSAAGSLLSGTAQAASYKKTAAPTRTD